MSEHVIRQGNIEGLLRLAEQPLSCMSLTPKKKDIFPYRARQPKLVEIMDYEGLELNIALYDVKTKKRKKPCQDSEVDEEGSFLLNEGKKIIAVGNFYIIMKQGEKCLLLNSINGINGLSQETRTSAVNALTAYSVQRGYKEILMPSS